MVASTQSGMTSQPPSTLRPAWRLMRPVLRPLACRLRSFFAGPLQEEIAALRLEVAELRAELHAQPRAVEPQIEAALERALLTLALDREQRRR